MKDNITIDKFQVGKNVKPMIVAEMSGNHNQSLDKALQIVEEVAKTGAHALKMQTYTADTLTIKSNKKDFQIKKKNPWSHNKNLWNLYKKAETSLINLDFFKTSFMTIDPS